MDIEMKDDSGEGRIERVSLKQALEIPSILLLGKAEMKIGTLYRISIEARQVSYIVSQGFIDNIAESIKAVVGMKHLKQLIQTYLLMQAKVFASIGVGSTREDTTGN